MSTERLVRTFTDLIAVGGHSREEAAVAAAVMAELEAAGCSVRTDDSTALTGSNTGNVIAEFPGTAPATLILSAHLDTVAPGYGVEPLLKDGVFYSLGDTVLGADDKAGLAAAIETVRRLADEPVRPTVRCVFSVAEEIGLVGAKALDPADVAGDLCLVLDADGRPGGIVVGAPTHYTFEARFEGRSAHAGMAPEKGVSAIEVAADAITRMRLGRLDPETTANVGSIAGGSATNVVTPTVVMTGECRSLDRPRVEALKAEMTEAMQGAADDRKASLDLVWRLEYEGFRSSTDDPALELVREAAEDAGLEPYTFVTGGGSDANIIAATGTPTFALSCGMQNVHSTAEYILLADLESLTQMLISAARRLAEAAGR